MYTPQYFRYLEFPCIPDSLLEGLNWNVSEYTRKGESRIPNEFLWSDDHNQNLDRWGKENICSNMYFAFQIIFNDLPLHKDLGTVCKLNYILDPGGDNVLTEWYEDDQKTLLQSCVIDPGRWHIFKADSYHTVKNLQPGRTRFAITARIFP